jgi:hypothetical protein
MIIKNNKRLFVLILTLQLIIFETFTNQIIDPEDNSNTSTIEKPNSLAIEISFDVYQPIMTNLMKLFTDTMQISMESNKTEAELMKFFEEIGVSKIQPIIIKYMNNVKKHKSSKELDPITLHELKLFLTFLYNFMLSIDKKNIENIDIEKIQNTEELNTIIDFLNQKNSSAIKSIKKVELSEFQATIDGFSRLINSMVVLTNNVITNIRKGKYINNGIYNSIFHPGKKLKTKYNISIASYQNEFLLPHIQNLNNGLQKQSLLLNDIKNLSEEISESRFKEILKDLFQEILKNISLLQYFLTESKFYPKNKKFSIEDKKMVEEESKHIQKKSTENYNKLIKKHKIFDIKSNLISPDKLLQSIDSINSIIMNCIQIEFELTLFKFQNYYRKSIFGLEKISNSNDFTKFCKNTLAPENWLVLMATWIGIDFGRWLSGAKSFGFWQAIAKASIDIKRFIDRGGDHDYNEQIVPVLQGVQEHYYKLKKARNGAFINNINPLDSLQEANELKARKKFIENGQLKEIKHLFEDQNSTAFLNENLYLNEQALWCENTLHAYADIIKTKETILKENQEIDKISSLIDYTILNAWMPERALEERCKENNIKNLNSLDAIIKLHKTKEDFEKTTSAQLKIYNEGWIRNNKRNSVEAALNGVYGGILAASIGVGFGAKLIGDSLVEKGITYYPAKLWNHFHYFMMGEKASKDSHEVRETIDSDSATGPTSIFDPTFNVLSNQGSLVWFKEMLNFVTLTLKGELYSGGEKITKCIGLFGPSGSGKTAVIKAFSNDIHRMIRENKSDIRVEFLTIDPKHFNGIISEGKKIQLDIIAELDSILEGIRVKGGFYIVHLDEFHLFFTKDGKVSQEKLADLLKFFNDLFVKQKSFKRIGGMYVICSTNKPQFIPHEFFDNGDRIGEVYEIKYPNGEQIISILKEELNHNNVFIDHIDFDYFSPLLEECNLTYGTIIKIANKALNIARIQSRTIDNNILYHAINDVVRKINFSSEENNNTYSQKDYNKNSLAKYYSALAAVAINFGTKHNSIYDLDMVTILPLKQNYSPEHIDRLYLKPERPMTKFGEAFYAKKSNNDSYSKPAIAIEIIKAIAPTVYLDSENIPKINKQSELASIYTKLYDFYATKIQFADCAKRIDLAKEKRSLSQDIYIADFNDTYSNQALHNHIISLLAYAEKELVAFYKNPEVQLFMEEVTQLLITKKIVTKQEILNNPVCSEVIEKMNIFFDNLFNSIIAQIQ